MKRLALAFAIVAVSTAAAHAAIAPMVDPVSCATAERLLDGRIQVKNLLIVTPSGVVSYNGLMTLAPSSANGGLGPDAYDLVRRQCFAGL